MKREIDQGDEILKEILSSEHNEQVKLIHNFTHEKEMKVAKECQLRKYNKLKERKVVENRTLRDGNNIVDKDRWIINLSDKQLSSGQVYFSYPLIKNILVHY